MDAPVGVMPPNEACSPGSHAPTQLGSSKPDGVRLRVWIVFSIVTSGTAMMAATWSGGSNSCGIAEAGTAPADGPAAGGGGAVGVAVGCCLGCGGPLKDNPATAAAGALARRRQIALRRVEGRRRGWAHRRRRTGGGRTPLRPTVGGRLEIRADRGAGNRSPWRRRRHG